MNHSIFFSFVAIASILILTYIPISQNLFLFLLLFFFLGLPHGALDIVLGKEMLEKRVGKGWWLLFGFAYLLLSLTVIAIWTFLPFFSFISFLMISMWHFGFGDALEKGKWRPFEGIARGLIPITAPAYFYHAEFKEILNSTLSNDEAGLITSILSSLFLPDILLISFFIALFLTQKKSAYAFELFMLAIVFIALPPFQAFLIYFCFLHSIRHTLTLMKETKKPFKALAYAAVLPTLLSASFLIGLYFLLRQKAIDFEAMYYLFFMGIAALTFPHMLLVEWLYGTSKRPGGSSA